MTLFILILSVNSLKGIATKWVAPLFRSISMTLKKDVHGLMVAIIVIVKIVYRRTWDKECVNPGGYQIIPFTPIVLA